MTGLKITNFVSSGATLMIRDEAYLRSWKWYCHLPICCM